MSHAWVKSGEDRLAVRAIIGLTGIATMLAPASLAGLPPVELVPWLAASVALHIGYQLVLVWSYGISDFSLAFPVARGSAPLFTTIGAVIFISELPAALALAGIAAISFGILVIARPGGLNSTGLFAALTTGLLTAGYTLTDAIGVRTATSAMEFIAWFFIAEGATIVAIFCASRRQRAWPLLVTNARSGLAAGLMAVGGFGATLWALRIAPVAVVSGLRETSVLFALLIAGRFLAEPMNKSKIGGSVLIALGAVMILSWTE